MSLAERTRISERHLNVAILEPLLCRLNELRNVREKNNRTEHLLSKKVTQNRHSNLVFHSLKKVLYILDKMLPTLINNYIAANSINIPSV